MEGQMNLDDFIRDKGAETYKIKHLIYSLSSNWFRTICPYCKIDNPDSTESNDCTKRTFFYRSNPKWYPYLDEPLDVCPHCGKRFDTNCEVRMTRGFMELNPEYVKKLYKDDKGKYYQERPEK